MLPYHFVFLSVLPDSPSFPGGESQQQAHACENQTPAADPISSFTPFAGGYIVGYARRFYLHRQDAWAWDSGFCHLPEPARIA
ncbi:MAG: hypothetical protein LUG96_01575 [Tannerellaceae bacterium]|nr:hypothetical protein [Tannerellaceae bacterium]